MADPWTSTFRSPSPDASSSDEDRPKTPPYARLNRDAQLARELDLSTRDDRAVFQATPFTIAKAQAHYVAVAQQKKALYRKTSNSSTSSGGKTNAPPRGPVPALIEEVPPFAAATTVWSTAQTKRKGPVPVIGAEALSKTPAVRGGWKMGVWKTATNVPIAASAPPPKPTKEVKAKGKEKNTGGEDKEDAPVPAEGIGGGAPLSRLETLLQDVDKHVAAQLADGGKGKGKAKAQPKAAAKRKKADADNEADADAEPPKKKRGGGGGRKKKAEKEEEGKITFGRIPPGAAESDYPIMQALANHKKLPAKSIAATKSATTKEAPKSKAKSTAKSKTPKKKPFTTLSFLSESSLEDVISSINLANLLPTPLLEPDEEKEGKKEVMSKFFGTSTSASGTTKIDETSTHGKSETPTKTQEAKDPPSTITHVNFNFAPTDKAAEQEGSPNKDADTSSSQLPYSSPLAAKSGATKSNTPVEILEPKPIRHADLEEISKLANVDGDTVLRIFTAHTRLAEQKAGEKGHNGVGVRVPELPKIAHNGRRSSPKSQIIPLPTLSSPPSARKPGFAQNGVFASQALKPGVASAFGRHTLDPYKNPAYDPNEWGTIRKRANKGAPTPSYAGGHSVAPLPKDWSRTGTHFKGGHTPSRPPQPPQREDSPPPPVPVGQPHFRLKEVWTPSAPSTASPPREKYRLETTQGSRYGPAAHVTSTASTNPFEAGSIFTRGENGQPRFRVPNALPTRPMFRTTPYHTREQYAPYPSPDEASAEENWEDEWKMQQGGTAAQSPRFEPARHALAHGPYARPVAQTNRFTAPTAAAGRFALAPSHPTRTRF